MSQQIPTPQQLLADGPAMASLPLRHEFIRNLSRDLRQMRQEMEEAAGEQLHHAPVNDTRGDGSENNGDEQEPGSQGYSGSARLPGSGIVRRLTEPSIGLLERVSLTCPVWLWIEVASAAVLHTLHGEPPGTFIVQRSSQIHQKTIIVRCPVDRSGHFVREYPIRETQSGFSITNSKLIFPDLCRLVAFYTSSRDLMDDKLVLPPVIQKASTRKQLESIAQMGIEFWCSPLHKDHHKRHSSTLGGSIYVRMDPVGNVENERVDKDSGSELCFVDPLFLHEQPLCSPQGQAQLLRMDNWRSGERCSTPSPAAVDAPPVQQQQQQQRGSAGWSSPGAGDAVPPVPALRQRPPLLNDEGRARRPTSSSVSSRSSIAMSVSSSRVSGSWQAVNRLSTSSSEPESDMEVNFPPSTPPCCNETGFSNEQGRRFKGILPGFRNVFDTISNTMQMPERRVLRCIKALASSRKSYFGCLVQDYVNLLKNRFLERTQDAGDGREILKSTRQTMTQFKCYLLQCNEIEPPLEAMISERQIDDVMERALCKCILKPLKATLEQALQATHAKEGISQRIQNNCFLARTQLPAELGVSPGVNVPDSATQDKIKAKLRSLSSTYSPEVKVDTLLKVCKMIYNGMGSAGEGGADDFFPVLTYSLLHCDCPELAIQVDYMVELLNPNLMSGERGYYLTSVYAALLLLSSLQQQATAQLQADTQQSLHEWRRSRMNSSMQHSTRSQNSLLMVSFRKCGSMAKTFATREKVTAREMCEICAVHFQVPANESKAFGLYAVIFNSTGQSTWHLLKDSDCPHSVWARLTIKNSIIGQSECYFVYKPLDDTNSHCSRKALLQGPNTSDGHMPPKRDSGNGNTFCPESNDIPIAANESSIHRNNTHSHETKL